MNPALLAEPEAVVNRFVKLFSIPVRCLPQCTAISVAVRPVTPTSFQPTPIAVVVNWVLSLEAMCEWVK